MTTYAAFLRGIMPTNPNMRNEKLKSVFESLGFINVQTLISSGNVIFSTKTKVKDITALESKIEKALFKELGIKSPAYIRSKEELESIIKKDPFKGHTHGPKSYLIVTFTKKKPREIFNNINTKQPTTAQFMALLDKEHGKDITTRTWKTVERMVKKMSA